VQTWARLRDVHAVRTPENVVFELELAGLTTRALGWAVDVCVMAALVGVAATLSTLFGLVLAGFAKAMYFLALFAIQWGYGAVLEWRWQGQTVGKRMVGSRVLASSGLAINFGQSALRNLLRVVDILPGGYLIGGVSVLLDPRCRRFGDIAADTVVVRVQRARRPVGFTPRQARHNSLTQDAAIVHAARCITAPEREVMLSLALRREQLPLPVRYALFATLARHLELRLGVRRPVFLSDERFVLNLVAMASQAGEAPRAYGLDMPDGDRG